MSDSMAPEMLQLKTRLRNTWELGDYGEFARYIEDGALVFLDRLNIAPGTKLLDVGCGAGQLTLPAAQRGIDVTGLDLAQNLVDQCNRRAVAAGLKLTCVQGDAEDLPFADNSFDIVLSLIGAMFAPRPELVASEMTRVCRSGGQVIMGNWTPDSHVGKMFRVAAKHAPPPAIFPSPMLWGDEAVVRQRFEGLLVDLRITERIYELHYPFPPEEVIAMFVRIVGPFVQAYNRLEGEAREAYVLDLVDLWQSHNLAKDGTTWINAEYLEIIGTKP